MLPNNSPASAQGVSLSGNCFASPSPSVVGQSVTWYVDVSGGDGIYSYLYLWSGSDSLSSANSSVSKVYRTPGVKTATVRVQSGGQRIFRNCSVVVENPESTGFSTDRGGGSRQGTVLGEMLAEGQLPSASCFANPDPAGVGENVVWQVRTIGFAGERTYEWSGVDDLSGGTEAVSISYRTAGIKSAQVLVSADGQKMTANCSVEIGDKNSIGAIATTKSVSTAVGGLPETSMVPFVWRIISLSILIIGGLILLSFVLILRRQRKAEQAEMSLAYSNNGISGLIGEGHQKKEIAEFIQSEARERQVLISTDALDLLVEKAENDKVKAVRCLDCLVSEMKELPYPTTPGEERLPVIDKNEVEKCLQRNKNL